MTVSIISSGTARRDNPVAARPHPRRAAVWTPFESVVVVVGLLLLARRFGTRPGGHRQTVRGPRLASSLRSVHRFLKDWWVHLAAFGGFAVVTIVGLLVISAQVPR